MDERSTWPRDQRVLIAAADRLEESPGLMFMDGELTEATGLDAAEVTRAVAALGSGGYLDVRDQSGLGSPSFSVHELTERGRRASGLWPSDDSVDGLVEALRQAEAATDDPEEKSLIRRAAGAIGSVSRDVMVDVLGAVASRQMGA